MAKHKSAVTRLFTASTLAVALAASWAPQASAAIITFDDVATYCSVGQIPDGYHGFDWDNFYALNTDTYSNQNSGYVNGVTSGNQVGFNGWGSTASMHSNSAFDFNQANLTGAWRDGLNVTVAGLLNGQQLYSQTVQVDSSSPSLFSFDFLGIDTLLFSASGGSSAQLGGMGSHFAIDDLIYNETAPVPEPGTLGLLAAGGLGLVFSRRRRKSDQV